MVFMDNTASSPHSLDLLPILNKPLVGLHALFVGLLSIWSSIALTPLVERFPLTDSGVFLYTGWKILQGALPYKDIWDHKGPLLYLINAAGLVIGGGTIWGVWLLQLLVLVLTLAFVYYLASTWFSPLAAFVGLFYLVLSFETFLEGGNLAEIYALPFTMLIYYFFYQSAGKTKSNHYPFIIGILGGLTFLLRPNLIGAMLVAGSAYFLVGLLFMQLRINSIKLAILIAGFLLTLALCAVILLALGVLQEFIQQTFLYNFSYSSGGDWGSRIAALKYGLTTLPGGKYAAILTLFGWLMIGVKLSVAYLRRDHFSANLQGLLLVFLGLPAEILISLISGRLYLHYFILWLPAIALTFSYLAHLLLSLTGRKWPVIFLPAVSNVLLVLFVMLLFGKGIEVISGRNLPISVDKISERQNLQLIEYINQKTDPEDEVLVWGGNAAVNFLSGRSAPTRFVYQFQFFDAGFTYIDWIEEFAAAVENRSPAVIVDYGYAKDIPSLDLQSQRAWLSDHAGQPVAVPVERYFRFVSANYELCTTIDQIEIYMYGGCR
jgi:hypothetical protein